MKLLLRGNVVSYGGALIILNRGTVASGLSEGSRVRLSFIWKNEGGGKGTKRRGGVMRRRFCRLSC